MSEYWVSHKNYFCKYCEIYIADDAPSRRQHESGLRHKGNRDRFVRGLYKQGERRKKDLEEEKREMARVEIAANAAFARDVSSGHASSSSSASKASQPVPSIAASKKPERPTSVWSDYSTAQSLGITDPDEERMKAEMERRKTQGVVGDWETVAPPPPPFPTDVREPKVEDSKDGVLADVLPQKREAEAPLEDEEDGRTFKFRKRTLGAGLGEIWDPGDIPIKLKSKPKSEAGECADSISDESKPKVEPALKFLDNRAVEQKPLSPTEEKPKWQPMAWKRATKPVLGEDMETSEETRKSNGEPQNSADPSIKDEPSSIPNIESNLPSAQLLEREVLPKVEIENGATVPVEPTVKVEESAAPATAEPTGGLFRKRKVPGGGRGKR